MASTSVEPLFIDSLWYYGLHDDDAIPSQLPHHRPITTNPTPQTPPEEDTKELHRVFDTMDEDHDEKLSGSELCAWMKKLGLVFTEEGMVRMVEAVDTHKRGTLDFEEFVALDTKLEAAEEAEEAVSEKGAVEQEFGSEKTGEGEAAHEGLLHEVFDLFDRDHNGLISPQDLRVTLDRIGLFKKGEEAEYVDMIRRADSDGDGQVSFSEFENMMDHGSMATR